LIAVRHTFQRNTIDDVERVNDIAKGFAHLSTVCIAHHGVEVHLYCRKASVLRNEQHGMIVGYALSIQSDIVLGSAQKMHINRGRARCKHITACRRWTDPN